MWAPSMMLWISSCRPILGGCGSPVRGVSRQGIRRSVLDAGNVYHFEVVSEGFFLEVAQSSVGDVIHGSISEGLQERLMVHCDS